MTRRECLRWLAASSLAASSARALFRAANAQAQPVGGACSFKDVTAQSGLHFTHSVGKRSHLLPEDMGSGLAWGDYDNDGYPDLYVVNQAGPFGSAQSSGAGDRLFHNNGNGTFTDVTERSGLEYHHCGMGAFWGDYDNDGHLDLFVTGAGRTRLYHNEGNGRFRDVTHHSGVFDPLWSTGAVWVDFDGDGWLDLYVLHYVSYPREAARLHFAAESQYGVVVPAALNPESFPPEANRLLRNNHDGTFTDVTHRAGVADADGRSLSILAADFNGDSWPELYVGNDLSMNRLYVNEKDGRFSDRTAQAFLGENKGTMGFAALDYNFDGALDLYVSHWLGQGDSLYQSMLAQTGRLSFGDVADMANLIYISLPVVSWGCCFLDFDNDGLQDLVVVNGNTLEDARNRDLLVPQKPFLFRYDGNQFHDVLSSVAPELNRPLNARGLAAADFDGDGDMDFAISCNRGPLILMRADGAEHRNWLKIDLQGRRSNRQGIGAIVRVSAGGKNQLQPYGSQGSYLSQHATPLHFGLGASRVADEVEVIWPSGRRQIERGINARQLLHLREP
ncbi:MAG TPA: CRTAC1 family protein [Candidatus Acidoferrales bacterium]|nr:CRTAC1 family protein [Candidatus Acidoferrales bacterium]